MHSRPVVVFAAVGVIWLFGNPARNATAQRDGSLSRGAPVLNARPESDAGRASDFYVGVNRGSF